jgi:peptide deformylase
VAVEKKEIKNPFFQKFVDDMVETMREYDGVGLAANQVHVAKRVIVIEIGGTNKRYNKAPEIPLLILLNPEIIFLSEEMVSGWEGCLSLSNLRGVVKRSIKVKVKGLDRFGKELIIEPEGFLNTVLQHEIDHLNSTVFVDRMDDMSTLSFLPEFEKYSEADSF